MRNEVPIVGWTGKMSVRINLWRRANRLLADRGDARCSENVIATKVTRGHSEWFYDAVCGTVERAIESRHNNVLGRVIDPKRLHDANEFCRCGRCNVVNGVPASYAYCCTEAIVEGESWNPFAVHLSEKIGSLHCITEHSSFANVCLDSEVLKILATHKKVCCEWPGPEEALTNTDYRYLAYRAFSFWVYGDRANGNELEPPSCVLTRIVQKFPVEEGMGLLQRRGLVTIFGTEFFLKYSADEENRDEF
uniref:P2X purinoreceptor 7 intracellular domain-containing protein n=2 Tax=Parascaris univalens TaxID=6257 RepID=A0A915AIQ1_PARUN